MGKENVEQNGAKVIPKTSFLAKWWWIIILAIALGILLIFLRGNEDSWIKDATGNWIKHGNPSTEAPSGPVTIPQKVLDKVRLARRRIG